MRFYTTGLKYWEQSEWKASDTFSGQLSVNCPFCDKVLCGLCFTASCYKGKAESQYSNEARSRNTTFLH